MDTFGVKNSNHLTKKCIKNLWLVFHSVGPKCLFIKPVSPRLKEMFCLRFFCVIFKIWLDYVLVNLWHWTVLFLFIFYCVLFYSLWESEQQNIELFINYICLSPNVHHFILYCSCQLCVFLIWHFTRQWPAKLKFLMQSVCERSLLFLHAKPVMAA